MIEATGKSHEKTQRIDFARLLKGRGAKNQVEKNDTQRENINLQVKKSDVKSRECM